MTDDQDWLAPGAPPAGATLPPPQGPPRPGSGPPPPPTSPPSPPAPASPASPASQPSAPSTPGATGWTPPPKPGLVPLHPMTLGTILSGSFRTLRRDPRTTLAPALVVSIITTGLAVVAPWFVTTWSFERLSTVGSDDYSAVISGTVALSVLAGVIPLVLSVVATAILQGAIVITVSRATLGERITFTGLRRRLRGRIGALVGWAGLTLLAIVTFLAIGVVAVIGVGSLGDAGVAAAVGLGILVVLGGVVLAFLLGTKLVFVPQMLVIERLTLGAAVRRSWTLIRGFFWRTLGIVLLVSVIVSIATSIVTTPVGFVAGLIFGLAIPTGGIDAYATATAITLIITGVVTSIAGAFGLVLQTSTSALLYLDTRMRREGLDLELARYVESRQRGAGAPDPFPAPASHPAAATVAGGSPWA